MSIARLRAGRFHGLGEGFRTSATVALLALTGGLLVAADARAREVQLTVHAGAVASGALFDAEAALSRPWETGGGRVEALELTAEVDEAAIGGARLSLALAPRLSLQAGASITRLDVTAQALSAGSRNVTLHEYDEITAAMFDLVLVARLTRSPSHAYVVGGGGLALLSFKGVDELDQSQPGVTLGAGYRVAVDTSFSLDLEVRDLITWIDTDDEPNRAAASSFDGASTLHLWQFTVGATFTP